MTKKIKQQADRRLPTADCRPQTANRRLPTADRRPQTADRGPQKAVKKVAMLVKGIRPSLIFDKGGNPEFSMEFTDNKVSEKTLEDILNLPENIASEMKRYIVVMDEFQEITKLNGDNFEKLLRSTIQHHQHVNYLFLGSRTHLLNDMFNNKGRAFYNSALLMQIETLPIDDTIGFLKTRFETAGILLDDKTARYIIEQAGNIPYYIQLLAAEIWQDMIATHKQVDKSMIALCAGRIVDLKSDYYTELYDRQSAYQKKLLNALMISGENVFSADYTKRFRLSATSTTQKALSGLVENGIVEKAEGSYFIGDPFFKRFLLRYA